MKRRKLVVMLMVLVFLALLFFHSVVWTKWVLKENPHFSQKQCNYAELGIKEKENSSEKVADHEFEVPNIVHYIWYRTEPVEFRFDQALGVLSALKYINPEAVYFHTNVPPKGRYFEMLKTISRFKVIHREPPVHVLKSTYHETDYSNFDRVKILIEQGGIYLDFDVIVIRSFDPLRRHNCTMGLEEASKLCAGVIICRKEHPFLYVWLNSYYDDFQEIWSYNSGSVPSRLVRRYKNFIHVEKDTLHRPAWYHLEMIWGNDTYPWQGNFAIHTWIRKAKPQWITEYPSPESIETMNNTYSQIARRVFHDYASRFN